MEYLAYTSYSNKSYSSSKSSSSNSDGGIGGVVFAIIIIVLIIIGVANSSHKKKIEEQRHREWQAKWEAERKQHETEKAVLEQNYVLDGFFRMDPRDSAMAKKALEFLKSFRPSPTS